MPLMPPGSFIKTADSVDAGPLATHVSFFHATSIRASRPCEKYFKNRTKTTEQMSEFGNYGIRGLSMSVEFLGNYLLVVFHSPIQEFPIFRYPFLSTCLFGNYSFCVFLSTI